MEAEFKKVVLFRGQGQKKWSASLHLPTGDTKIVETEFTEQRRAQGTAAQQWRQFAQEKGVLPRASAGRPPQEPMPAAVAPIENAVVTTEKNGHVGRPHIGTLSVGLGVKPPHKSPYEALGEVVAIVSGLNYADREWVVARIVGLLPTSTQTGES